MSDSDVQYIARFAFEHRDSANLPADERGGYKEVEVFPEREPKTNEEFDEIAKVVFRAGNYKEIRLLGVYTQPKQTQPKLFKEGEVLRGETIE